MILMMQMMKSLSPIFVFASFFYFRVFFTFFIFLFLLFSPLFATSLGGLMVMMGLYAYGLRQMQTDPDSYASPSASLISLIYLMAAFSANLFGLFCLILELRAECEMWLSKILYFFWQLYQIYIRVRHKHDFLIVIYVLLCINVWCISTLKIDLWLQTIHIQMQEYTYIT